MKVALAYDLVYPFSYGGVEKRVWEMARRLSVHGHEIHILGTKHWNGPNEVVINEGVHVHGICAPADTHTQRGRRSIRQAVRYAVALGRRIGDEKFDVVDVQNMAPLSCLAALIAARRTKTPVVVTWHEVWGEYWRDYMGALGGVGRLIERLVGRLGQRHVAVSVQTMSRLAAINVRDVTLILNGIDAEVIEGIPAGPITCDVIYVGRLASHKNLELLFEAVAVLQERGVEASVIVVGEGPEREHLERLVISLGLDTVEFLGRVESEAEVFGMIKSASVLALPSLREGFGIVALEAFACSTPVVTVWASTNAAYDLVVENKAGIGTSANPTSFARALGDVLADEKLATCLAANAQAAARRFGWPSSVKALEDLYLEVQATVIAE